MSGLTLITPTGGRPEAFMVCQAYMAQQSYKGDVQWIVVDDCEEESPYQAPAHWELLRLRPQPFWHPGENTQCRNMLLALEQVRHDKILIIEDDDYYHPRYLELMSARLQEASLVGEKHALYYNVAWRCYHHCCNESHASLCQTGFTRKMLPEVLRYCQQGIKFIDIELFRTLEKRCLYPHTGYCIGIKGLPGRKGIGIGHSNKGGTTWAPDRNLRNLRKWIGTDANLYYARYFDGDKKMANDSTELKTFVWRGQTRYQCPSCGFDGPSELEVLKHWRATHAEQNQLMGPTLFDAEGKELTKKSSEELVVPAALRRFVE